MHCKRFECIQMSWNELVYSGPGVSVRHNFDWALTLITTGIKGFLKNAACDPLVVEVVYCGIDYQVFAMLQGTHSSPALTHITSARLPGLTLELRDQVGINLHFCLLRDLLTLGISGEHI